MKAQVVYALLGAVLLTGCGAQQEPQEAQPTYEPAVIVEQLDERDDMFLEVVREHAPSTADVSDELLIEVALQACAMLDDGYERSDLSRIARESGMSPEVHGTILGAGIAAYCREHYEW